MTSLIMPEEYANSFRNASTKEIIRERDRLIRDIRHYEKIRNSDRPEDYLELIGEINDSPVSYPPSEQYSHNLSCLAEICNLLAERRKYNIIITSGGFNTVNNYVSDDNVRLFKEISEGKKVLIIANAAPEGSGNYVARENVKENFLNVGAIQADVIDLNANNTSIIFEYDVLYCLGGDVQYLVELIRDTDIEEKLEDFLELGNTYIGESAGSIILAYDVEWIYKIKKGTKPKYDVTLDTYEGFGFTDLLIYPHYQKADENMRAKITEYEDQNGAEITRLNDGDIISL